MKGPCNAVTARNYMTQETVTNSCQRSVPIVRKSMRLGRCLVQWTPLRPKEPTKVLKDINVALKLYLDEWIKISELRKAIR